MLNNGGKAGFQLLSLSDYVSIIHKVSIYFSVVLKCSLICVRSITMTANATAPPRRPGLRIKFLRDGGEPPFPKKQRKTAAECSRDYRARLKEDPEAYKVHREYENARVKCYVAGMTTLILFINICAINR